ncbi:MAG: hypothetical protein VB102_14000 [Paludibacter sp.]|nr:hypothetical protein [Paludibacter sp.]
MKRIILCFVTFATSLYSALGQEERLTPIEEIQQKVETQDALITKLNNFKITGYIQTQYQWGEKSANLKVGSPNTDVTKAFNRIGIRRGRLKFTYDAGDLASGVFHLNIIDKPGLTGATIQLKEAYIYVKDPWFKNGAVKAGIFDRPFGNEVSYSSSLLESTERSRIISQLFPEESDLGGMLVLQPDVTSPLGFLKLEGGFFAGNAINPETDNRKDFIGHLSATKPIGNSARWGLGTSYYNGGVYMTTAKVYSMNDGEFTVSMDNANIGKYAKREYFGFDGQFSFESPLGMTQLRGEYIWGTQPGSLLGTSSPNRSSLPSGANVYDTYLRPMSGWYAILVQDIGQIPFSAVIKYDVYDPNTGVSGNEVGRAAQEISTNCADIKYNTLGFGLLWRIQPSLRLQAYYEFVKNETTSGLEAFSSDQKDNSFTLRLQYKF